MSGGKNDEFLEERCAPMRRGSGAPKSSAAGLPPELKPKFPKPEEIMPVEQQPQTPETPQIPLSPAEPAQKTLEQEVIGPEGENQEIPLKEVESLDQGQDQKKKKTSKKPKKKKKDDERAVAVFMNDDQDEANNAVGQFMDDEEEEKKGKKEKGDKGEKSKLGEKDSNRDKNKEGGEKKDEKPKVKKAKQQKTDSCRQKNKAAQQSGRQRKPAPPPQQGSLRKPTAAAKLPVPSFSMAPPPALPSARIPPPKPVQPSAPPMAPAPGQAPIAASTQVPVTKAPVAPLTPEQKAAKERERLAREPNEGFLKAMYARAKQKVMAIKTANPVPIEASIGDDTLIANENEIIKPEVTAVYGAPTDYPKKVIPPKNDKSHPDKLFPAGRPFWMNRDEKPPQARVIMMSVVESCLKQKTFAFTDNPPRTDPFAPYCENIKNLQKTDAEYFTGYKLLLSNTSRNCCVMRATAIKVTESEKLRPRKKSMAPRKAKVIPVPTLCQVYNRKDQKKKPPSASKPILMGKAPKKKKVKKSSSSSSSSGNSNSSAD